MRQLAREFSLSETVFVLPPNDPKNTRRLRIFTPDAELPFAGHPTLGAAFVLVELGYIPAVGDEMQVVFEEGVGPIRVNVNLKDGHPLSMQLESKKAPEFGPDIRDPKLLAELLNLSAAEIEVSSLQPKQVSCGVPFQVIPLRTREALRRARLNHQVWEEHFRGSWAPQIYPIAWEDETRSTIAVRMFGPALGIAEDPATGAGATALAGYLASYEGPTATGAFRWTVHQGHEIGRPSTLEIEAEVSFGAVKALRVGGRAVMVSEGQIFND
jgi:trans-2,3-dihydro-3-hydroxyanthranilate isomerase